MNGSGSRREFFRQSGWMTVATLLSGAFNMASFAVANKMSGGEYNIFELALAALAILAIPTLGMQASFAALAAGADTSERQRELSAATRGAMGLLGAFWLLQAGWWLVRHKQIMAAYHLTQPAMLWLLLLICLVTLLTPVPSGVLQGRQDFLWYGWATLLNGLGRFAVLLVVVKGLDGRALGCLGGVLAGSLLVLLIVVWRTRDVLAGAPGSFRWRDWLRRLVPVTVGLGALTFIMQADALIVSEKLQPFLTLDETNGYYVVRKIALAMVFTVGALTTVMFPKVARSFQRSEQTDVLRLTVILTVAIGVIGAALASVFPELPLRLLSPSALLGSKTLVPAYCWALLPMAVASVLVWSLLARECYRAVPWMAALALGYWLALQRFHDRLTTVIGVVALFGSLLLALCAVFVWFDGRRNRTPPKL
jgi:O-antigen/teichoic acid export membrane protein